MACPDIDITQYLLVLYRNQVELKKFFFILLELLKKAISDIRTIHGKYF